MFLTEADGKYQNLEQLSIAQLLNGINEEDHYVAVAVKNALPMIENLAEAIYEKLSTGGRLFYIGAGTSGRLGIVDASECPPTFGVPNDMVVGIIAGGDSAIRVAVEYAEDDETLAWSDLQAYHVSSKDIVVGIAASGKTPYVLGGLKMCNDRQIATGSICCNPDAPISKVSKYPVVVLTGPEFVRGSTRMKAGTAQKMVLNMLTTTAMIKLGKVKGNKMVDMQLSNRKLINRAVQMVVEECNISEQEATKLVETHSNVRKAIDAYYALKQ